MGLFDAIAGKVIGKMSGDDTQSAVIQAAIRLSNEYGGLQGILQRFSDAGFAKEVDSWVGLDKNLPISAEQIVQVLGQDELDRIAQQVNIAPAEISANLAEYLPRVVNKLTPDGVVPASQSQVLMRALALLKS